jgi:EAL domain-containing protein (putative c-di-GMP-specific phosphodiesterase class I)
MRSGEVFGFEALLRWNHPERGVVMPMEYLPLIEQTDLIMDIGMWVMRDALRQLAAWREEGLNTKVSINLGACHFRNMEFVGQLRDVLAQYPTVPPSALELEILECAALDDIQTVRAIMLGCQELGVTFALDDFGAGYSSLAYLKRLPANMLKIDQSFVHNMLEDSGDLTIIEGVVSMASIFNLDVIAEGVETMEQGVLLMRLGCGMAQGHGIARPMRAMEVPLWIAQFEPDPSWLRWANTRWDLADFPLLMAQSDHVQWVKRVMMAIEGASMMLNEGELKSHHHCRFGHWYYGRGKERYGHLTCYYDLEPIHASVHEVGVELIRLRNAGDVEAVADLCPKLMDLQHQVLEKLADLQNAVIRTF